MTEIKIVENFVFNLIGESNFFDVEHDKSDRRTLKNNLSDFLKRSVHSSSINFFPSDKKSTCKKTAWFVSIYSEKLKKRIKGKDSYEFSKVVEKLIQQVLGSCYKINEDIIVITDNLNTKSVEPWKKNLKVISQISNSFNIYFISEKGDVENINKLFGV